MKNEKILEALSKVDEAFIEEAAPGKKEEQKFLEAEVSRQQSSVEKKTKSPYGWVKWVALAACMALVIGVGASRLFRTINDDKRSSWPEGEDYAFALTDDMMTALTTTDTAIEFSSNGDEGFPDWGLTLSVKDVTSTGLTLVCTKNGGNSTGELMCGEDYQLITLKDGTWKAVATVITNYGFNSMGYWISEGTDTEFAIDWEWLYGKLTAGTYRLRKGFMDRPESGDYDTAMYWVEFEIEE